MSEYLKRWEKRAKNPSGWQRHEAQLDHPDRKWLYRHAKEPILDVGCGTALDSEGFKEYVGLDVTPSFLRSARFDYGVERLVLGDARFLPFREGYFASAYCKDLLLHLEWGDALMVLNELLRVGRRTYVAWGIESVGGEKVFYTPLLDGEVVNRRGGYWYNRFNLQRLNRHFNIGKVKEGTSVTEVNT